MTEAFELAIFEQPSALTVGSQWLPLARACCECGDQFLPVYDHQIRCVSCQVASDLCAGQEAFDL